VCTIDDMTSRTAACPVQVKLEIPASKPGKWSHGTEAWAPGVEMCGREEQGEKVVL
jgi:hypothetical protein